ncbi:uncharacterized protein DSM5745_09495 [Aspergillus mulundensis]|uniref:NACHT domain-containing protein n=1 Tax=Aspergillus mulundensis TaxID=1810919 RepID=A0A3D8QV87_9EURO|nr:hypothetical protein DSM5745_09495 [Aspergillus mulundensis]RDW65756.1 hypothetical protein DSM5745_09495 [Aspergillus mulundensis]
MEDEFVVVERADLPPSREESWLEPTDYRGESSEFQQHLNSLVPGTGEWIEQTPEFQQWRDSSSHGALWIKAIAGAGKSVLVARLVSLLQQQKDIPVLFFFFRQIVIANHGPHSLVRDWLVQLCRYSPDLVKRLETLRESNKRVQDVAFNELWQILLDTLGSLGRVYCVVDALDELDTRHTADFLPRLVALGQLAPDRVKVVMSSRPLPQIQAVLKTPSVLEVRLENAQVNKDIALFVDYRLRTAQLPDLDEPALAEVKKAIGNRAHPSFLYARLLLSELLDKHAIQGWSEESVRQSLRYIPESLEDLYTQMLRDHSEKASVPQERQFLILQLVTHATRPLRLLEIATVLDFLSMGADREGKYPDTKAMTRMSCGPLLEILNDETVSIIHHSFTEFLTDTRRKKTDTFPVVDPEDAHRLMARICLRYICGGGLSLETVKNSPESMYEFENGPASKLRKAQMDNPFIDYAARNWPGHVRHLTALDSELLQHLQRFLHAGNDAFLAWVIALMKPGKDPIPSTISPLHAAAWAGIANYVENLLSAGQDPNVVTKLDETPIAMAARNGHADVVETLLRHGAAPDEPDYFGMKPLHHAARANHHAVVKALVDAGVDPSTQKTRDPTPRKCGNMRPSVGQTPLEYACGAGAIESIRAMLPHFTAGHARSAIWCCMGSSRIELLRLLVTFPGLEFSSEFGGRCLMRAAENANLETLQLLLKLGANARYQPQRPRFAIRNSNEWQPAETVLLSLCRSMDRMNSRLLHSPTDTENFEKCLDLVLQAGCDVDARDPRNSDRTALFHFAEKSLPGIEKLLEAGANVHATDRAGNTPLHVYSPRKGSERTLAALLQHGARWDVINPSDGKTPLHSCFDGFSSDHNPEVLQPYISDWNIPDWRGDTVLHCVAERHSDLVRKLLELGADPNRRNHAGKVPLHLVHRGDDIDALLAAGADLEARDNKGRTVLLRNVVKSDAGVLQHLLNHGANLRAVDFEGNGALGLAIGKPMSGGEVFEFLLKAGADAGHLNHNGDTLYHRWIEASLEGSPNSRADRRIYNLLLEHSASSPTMPNSKGRTILHCMCSVPVGYRETLWRPEENVLEWQPLNTLQELIETADSEGRRPIHDAAATSEELVAWLMQKGAALTALTHKRETVLHMAARAKESNALGLLVESLDASQLESSINQQDDEGRTPLFYACRSGDLQSVMILLEAGSNVHISDNNKETPLHACAHFKAQRVYPDRDRHPPSHDEGWRKVIDEDETLGVQGIIRALISRGADVLAQDKYRRTPLEIAVQLENEEMVASLVEETRQAIHSTPNENGSTKTPNSPGQLVLTARHTIPTAIVDQILQSQTHRPVQTYHWLLKLRAYDAIRALARRGMPLVGTRPHDWDSFLHDLVQLGMSELLDDLGKIATGEHWVDGSTPDPNTGRTDLQPFLILAAGRKTPSVDLLKVIVETFHADTNIQTYDVDYSRENRNIMAMKSPLSILAAGKHWWHRDGIRYLLQRGANPNLCNGKGQSPLHIAVKGGYRRASIVRILLEHGANPDLVDLDGNTPLSLAAGDPDLVRLLLQHGADIHLGSNPVLFTAIGKQDVDSVRIILEAGVDCNKPFSERSSSPVPEKAEEESAHDLVYGDRYHRWNNSNNEEDADRARMLLCRPLHYACHARFNRVDRGKAVEIVKLLLEHGANPFLPVCPDESEILIHDVIYQWGIVEPLLAIPNLDPHLRDGSGRTLLLAACSPQKEDFIDAWGCGKERDNWRSALGSAVARREHAITRLCDLGADVTATDGEGNTALHLLLTVAEDAEANPLPDEWTTLLSFMLAQRPDMIHQRNNAGYTPFHMAAANRQFKLIPFLIDHGSNPLEPDPNGNNVLHHLAPTLGKERKENHFDVFDTFIAGGLDINARNALGESPLFKYIASVNCERVISHKSFIIEGFQHRGADILSRNNNGETMLHLVAQMSCTHGIGCDARFWGRGKGEEACGFMYLMGLGLDPMVEDVRQRSAVDIAAAYGKIEILEMFKKV